MQLTILLALLLQTAPNETTPPAGTEDENTAAAETVEKAPDPLWSRVDKNDNYFQLVFNFYEQEDEGGNPNEKEDLTIYEPVVVLRQSLSDDLSLTLKGQADIISSASIKDVKSGASSGASGDRYFSGDAALFYAWDDQTTLSTGVSWSKDYDYRSLGFRIGADWSTEGFNDTFSLKVSHFSDEIDIILFDATKQGTDDRTTTGIGLGWTTLLDKVTVASLSYDLTLQEGTLHTPFNSVVAAGTEVPEVLPDDRIRHACFGKTRRLLLPSVAAEVGAGFYFDDWKADAWHTEVSLWWEMSPGRIILRPGYRYHSQGEVDDWVDPSAAAIPEYRTQDSDLGEFTSDTWSLKMSFPRARVFGLGQLDLSGSYTERSDDLFYYTVSFGYTWRW